ncbi:MAG: hypothetical protein HYY24_18860 [Verrucomicrobia bacterium]|nr:hypothetical protein [Verrucomicrobiota bacterium]
MCDEQENLKTENEIALEENETSTEQEERDEEQEQKLKTKPRWNNGQKEPQPRCFRRGLVTDAPLTLKI